MSRARRFLAAARCAVLIALAPAAALAHAQLHGAEPAAGAVVAVAPEAVRLRFNEPVAPLPTRWVFPDGTTFDVEPSAEGETLVVPAPADAPQGTHAVSWRVVSGDGHPVGGVHVFSIGAPSETPEIAPDRPAWAPASARLALTLALALGAGGAFWAAMEGRRPGPVARIAAVAAAPTALAMLAAQTADLAGEAAALGRGADWLRAATGPFGLAAALGAGAGLLAATAGGRTRASLALALAAASYAAAGHAARVEPVALMAPLVFLHAAAMLFWAGALPELVSARADAAGLARFSRLAAPVVAALALSGGALAVVQLEAPQALWTTGYGLLLSAKLAVVAAALALAARHRFVLSSALSVDPDRVRPRYLASLRIETALLVAVLGLTAGFRLTSPPWAMTAETELHVHLHGVAAMADLTIIPGRRGANRVVIRPLDADFAPFAPLEVELFFSHPASGLGPFALRAEPAQDGTWTVETVHLPASGVWDMRLDLLITDFRKEMIGGEMMMAP
ncbi:copper resistance CopC/CopD family protein [Rubrimonas sp.]|uniref:copper resistance CopC/CopD family protein n=1 Tax=Rubrimonas sp. TaxID=2036015 RepID=UPI002FDD0943